MKSLLAVSAVVLSFVSAPAYCVVIPAANVRFNFGMVNDPANISQFVPGFGLVVDQNLAGDYTELTFKYTPVISKSMPSTLQTSVIDLDESCDVYLAQPGAVFSASTIAAGQFTPICIADISADPIVPIPLGDFFLGLNTGVFKTPPFQISQARDVFGWIELYNDGDSLTEVSNAMAYNESGIVIGAPEPSFALALLGFALFGVTKRRLENAS